MAGSELYPRHYSRTRPYSKAMGVRMEELISTGRIDHRVAAQTASGFVVDEMRKAGIGPNDPEFNGAAISIEMQAALMHTEFMNNGSAVYFFDDQLTAALKESDPGDVCINDLLFPFNCAYLHFEGGAGGTLRSGYPVTGAYVMYAPGSALRICLTAPLPEGTPWPARHRELYDLRIPAALFDDDLETAIGKALDTDIEDIQKAAATLVARNPYRSQAVDAAEDLLENHRSNRDAYSRCLSLIAGALCYLTAYPADNMEIWQPGTPPAMVRKTVEGTPKEIARNTSKLNALGYRRIRYIGSEFGEAARQAERGEITPHLRRGHWRRQRHGPGLKQVTIKWLKPTRVMGSSFSREPRVYNTNPPD